MEITVSCPWCHGDVVIEKLACAIFRHGIYKSDGRQIHPHAPKHVIDDLIKNDAIHGCGLPFQVVNSVAVKCGYI